MSEEKKNPEQRESGNKGGGKKLPGPPRFNFNFYWIYGIIIVILILTQLFQWGGTERKTTFDKFERNMLMTKDVDRIVVTNDVAHIYIKPERLKEDKYKDVRTKTWGNIDNPGPHFILNTGPAELFAKKIEEAQKDFPA